MRYWIMLGDNCEGPLEADQIGPLCQDHREAVLCPEGRNPLHHESWQPVHLFPDIPLDLADGSNAGRDQLALKSHPAVSWKAWALLALLGIGALIKRLPAPTASPPEQLNDAPAEPPERRPTIYETVQQNIVPPCDPSLGPASRSDLEATLSEGGYLLRWTPQGSTVGGDVQFQYDPERKLLKPLNPGAKQLLNRRIVCAPR